MPETCENWCGLVNSDVYYAHQTRETYQVLPYSIDFKAPGEMTVKLKSNLYVAPVNIFS